MSVGPFAAKPGLSLSPGGWPLPIGVPSATRWKFENSMNLGGATRSAVTRLLLPGTPLTVLGFKVSFIVHAQQDCADRPFAHVFTEVLETMPPGTHSYAMCTAKFESEVIWVSAPGEHVLPTLIQRLRLL